jgi:DNA-binding CsgD family transcriptional regulator
VKSQSSLTQRELEIAGLIADGLTSQQIAARLFISQRTVTTHVTNIDKLGLSSRIQLASWVTGARQPPGAADT